MGWFPGWLPQIAPALRGGCALLTSEVVGPGGVGVRLGGVGLLIPAFLPRQVVGGHGSQGPRQCQEASRAPQLRGMQPGRVGREGHGGAAAGRCVCVGEVLLWRKGRGERALVGSSLTEMTGVDLYYLLCSTTTTTSTITVQ